MNLHEFQAKQLFKGVGIPIPLGEVVDTAASIATVVHRLGGSHWVVKAQVHAGERTVAGGVRHADNISLLQKYARAMLGERLITPHNAPLGQPVNQLLIEVSQHAVRNFYINLTIESSTGQIVFLVSSLKQIREDGLSAPLAEGLSRIAIDPIDGLQLFQCRQLAVKLGMDKKLWKQFFQIIQETYNLFIKKDLLQIEINSLAELDDGTLIALNAKIRVDDNALSRQPSLAKLNDITQDNCHQYRTLGHGLGITTMEGDIGCIVNGTGLSLATLDMIQLAGGNVGNIVDVGDGRASIDELSKAFKLLWSVNHCKVVLVNIVGGIVKCDVVAAGVVDALQKHHLRCTVVVRMEGSRVEEAYRLFMQCGQRINIVNDLDEAVKAVVQKIIL